MAKIKMKPSDRIDKAALARRLSKTWARVTGQVYLPRDPEAEVDSLPKPSMLVRFWQWLKGVAA